MNMVADHIVFPSGINMLRTIDCFNQKGWKNACGIIDGTLIPCKCPSYDREAMYTRKGFTANNHLLVVDAEDIITAIKAGKFLFYF